MTSMLSLLNHDDAGINDDDGDDSDYHMIDLKLKILTLSFDPQFKSSLCASCMHCGIASRRIKTSPLRLERWEILPRRV